MRNIDFTPVIVVGVIVAALSVLSKVLRVPDQIKKNFERKSTEGLSLLMYSITFTTYFFWTIYGALKNDWPVMLAQGALGCIVTGVILWQFFLYRKKK